MDAADIAKKYRRSDPHAKSSPPARRGYGSSEADLLVKNIRLENDIKDCIQKTDRYKQLLEAAQDDANELSAEVRTLTQQKATLQQTITDCCKLLNCTKLPDGVQQTTKQLSKTKSLLVSILSHGVDEREENDVNRQKSIDQLAKEVAITYREMRESCQSMTTEGSEITHQIDQQHVEILRLTAELREEKFASAEAMKVRGNLAKQYDTLFSSNKHLIDNIIKSLIRQCNERIMRHYYNRLLSSLNTG
eukprot:TRINITY_DN3882_c0_g1_i2.p1 TRINITY_DN3882_c0_g1~~TRINITY_DN3882_c0_g1_i2.p1  ORF type:complete len:248 (+),score=67.69 TRINITY_DN3882_c0_g1_i2:465-1208(+)